MRNMYWGDIHRQTAWTCGEGTVDDHFAVAKSHFGLDFAAVTDNARLEDPRERLFPGERLRGHRHFLGGLQAHSISQSQWLEVQAAVRRHTEPGAFIALLAYEWCSARYGDHNVYYAADQGPLLLPDRLEDLYAGCEPAERLVIPHHPGYARGRRGINWNVHSPIHERLVEIHSTQHGCSEGLEPLVPKLYSRSMGGLTPGSSVQDALQRGYKLGFTGGSDSHTLKQKSGLVGVYAPKLERSSLFGALRQRRTIATTGPKFPAYFHVDGHGPGSMLTLDTLPLIQIELPDNGWDAAQLVRNGEVVAEWVSGENGQHGGHLQYRETPAGLLPDNYYYVRLFLEAAERAWISPIWLSYLPDTEFARDTLYWLPEGDVLFWGQEHDAETVKLEALRHRRADSPVELLAWQLWDAAGQVIWESQQGGMVTPGQRVAVALPKRQAAAAKRHVLLYRDAEDNERYVVRSRWAAANELGTFPYV